MTYTGFKQNTKMAFRSMIYRKKQYTSLFSVCIFGIAMSVFCIFLVSGMIQALLDKAKIYYGGDLVLMGGVTGLGIEGSDKIIEKISPVFGNEARINSRYVVDGRDASLYYDGTSVLQQTLIGIDFEAERNLLQKFNYAEGGAEELSGRGDVMISQNVAAQLGVGVGDTISLMISDYNNQMNTEPLTVRAIFIDSSVFGMYTTYLNFETLKILHGESADETFTSRICIDFEDAPPLRKVRGYQKSLESLLPMFHLVSDKSEFLDALYEEIFTEQTFALIPLSANLKDVNFLIRAMQTISFFIIIILTAIIAAGISSTYRVLILKRINEIGTYKALGMTRRRLTGMILQEVLFVVLAGCLGGAALSVIMGIAVRGFDFSFIPAFDMFLANGRLRPALSLGSPLAVGAVVCVTTLAAVLFSVRNALVITPAQALSATE